MTRKKLPDKKPETPNGQKLLLKDNPDSVQIDDSFGNSIKLEGGGITTTLWLKQLSTPAW